MKTYYNQYEKPYSLLNRRVMWDAVSDGNSAVTGAYNQGAGAINSFDPKSFQQSTQTGQNNLYGIGGAQNKQMNDYIQSYKDTINNQPSATQYYQQGNDMYNVPQLKQQANALNNAVLQAPQNTVDSARGFNYDNNQVQNQTNLTLGRLSPLAQSATNQAQTAEGLASGYANAGMEQNTMNLQPIQTEGTQLQQQWAQQATGYDANAKNTLDALTAKMQSGAQLSADEMAQFSALAQKEEDYNQAIGTANIGATAQQNVARLNNQFQNVPYANRLVNTATGKVVR